MAIIAGFFVSVRAQDREGSVMELPDLVIVSSEFTTLQQVRVNRLPMPFSMALAALPKPAEKEVLSAADMSVPDPAPSPPESRGCMSSCGPISGLSARSKLVKGYRLLEAGQARQALDLLQQFVNAGPNQADLTSAGYWMAFAHFHLGEDEDARSVLADTLKLARAEAPEYPYILWLMSSVGFMSGDWDTAEQAAGRIRERFPGHELIPYTTLRLAQTAALRGRFAAAEAGFQKACIDPELAELQPDACFWRAEMLFRQEKYREAAEVYGEFVVRYPSHARIADARYGLAWCAIAANQLNQAQKLLSDLTASGGAQQLEANILYLDGRLDMANGSSAAALDKFQRVLALPGAQPWRENIAAGMVWLLYHEERYEESLDAAQRFLQDWPSGEHARTVVLAQGADLMHLGRCSEAIPLLQRLTSLPAGEFAMQDLSLLQMGVCLLAQDDPGAADSAFSELLASYPQSPYSTDALYWRGEARIRLRDLNNARADFLEVARSKPGEAARDDALLRIGWTYYLAGDWQRATVELENALAETVQSGLRAESELALADSYYNLRQFDKALAHYQKAAETESVTGRVKFQAVQRMAMAYQRMGKFDEAERVLHPLLDADDPEVRQEALFQQALASFQQRRFQEAANRFQNFIHSFPASPRVPDAQLKIGDALYNLKQLPEAERAYSVVVEQYGNSPQARDAQFGLAFCFLQRQDIDGYLRRIEELLARDPGSPYNAKILTYAADAVMEEGRYSQAASLYERVRREYPGAAGGDRVIFPLAKAYLAADRPVDAMQLLEANLPLLKAASLDADAYLLLARTAHERGEDHQALKWLDQLLDSPDGNPLREEALYLKGIIAVDAGGRDAADAAFKALLRDFPSGRYAQTARFERGRLAATGGQCDVAAKLLAEFISGEGTAAAEARFLIGQCLRAAGQQQEALGEFMAIVYLHQQAGDWPLRAALAAGEIATASGRPEEALALYRKMVGQAPAGTLKQELERRIAELQ